MNVNFSENSNIDFDELRNYTRLEDSYIYFSNVNNIPPPDVLDFNTVQSLLNSIGIDSNSSVFQDAVDPENMTISTVDFLDGLHMVTVDPEKLNCASGMNCSILFLPILTILEKADGDVNGVLSFAEFSTSDGIQKWRKMVFTPYDFNNDGLISEEEWKQYLAAYVEMEVERRANMENETVEATTTVASNNETFFDDPVMNPENLDAIIPTTTLSANNETVATTIAVTGTTAGFPVPMTLASIMPNIPISENTSTDVPPTVNPPTVNPTTIIPPTIVPPTVVPSTANPPTVNPPTENSPTVIPPTVVPPTANPPTVNPPTENSPITILSTVNPPTVNPPTIIPPTANPPTENSPTTISSTSNPPTVAPPTIVAPTIAPPTIAPPAVTGTTNGLPIPTESQNSVNDNPQCTGTEVTESVMKIVFNLTFCGGTVLDYASTFHAKDSDSDGVLSPSELESGCFWPFVDKLFCMSDSNQDAVLDPIEFSNFVVSEDEFNFFWNVDNESPPQSVSEQEFQVLLEKNGINSTNPNLTAIQDENGNININHFFEIIHSVPEIFECRSDSNCSNLPKPFPQILASYDANQDSVISFDEFKNSAEIKDYKGIFFSPYDFNKDGVIEFSEWETYLSGYIHVANFSKTFEFFDANNDTTWDKTELFEFLVDKGIVRKNAWEVIRDNGPLTEDTAYQFANSLPNPKFKYFMDTAPENVDESLILQKPDPAKSSVS